MQKHNDFFPTKFYPKKVYHFFERRVAEATADDNGVHENDGSKVEVFFFGRRIKLMECLCLLQLNDLTFNL